MSLWYTLICGNINIIYTSVQTISIFCQKIGISSPHSKGLLFSVKKTSPLCLLKIGSIPRESQAVKNANPKTPRTPSLVIDPIMLVSQMVECSPWVGHDYPTDPQDFAGYESLTKLVRHQPGYVSCLRWPKNDSWTEGTLSTTCMNIPKTSW